MHQSFERTRAAAVELSARIHLLDDGEVAGLGTHEELLRDCEVYREIEDSQEGGAR